MEPETIKTDFYICLPTEADMATELPAAFYHQETEVQVDAETGEETVVNVGDPVLVQYTSDYAMDVVGVIQKPTGNILTDADGNEYPEMAPIPGWHLNIRLLNDNMRAEIEALDVTYGVMPDTPERVRL